MQLGDLQNYAFEEHEEQRFDVRNDGAPAAVQSQQAPDLPGRAQRNAGVTDPVNHITAGQYLDRHQLHEENPHTKDDS